MTPLGALWLPVVLSAVAVFVVSSVIHMFSPWHKHDFGTLRDEAGVMAALRQFDLRPDDYMAPRAESMDDMRSEEFKAKRLRGPAFIMTVFPPTADFSMTPNLVKWFIYLIIVSAAAACVAGSAVRAGAPAHTVFHYTALVSFLTYTGGLFPASIWYQKRWSTTLKSAMDSLIYGLVTGGIFLWLWPHM